MTQTSEPIGPFCASLGRPSVIYYDWIYPIMYSFAAALMIPVIHIYLKSYIVSKLRIPKLPFSVTLIYFIIQFITYVLIGIWARYECHSLKISKPIHIAGITSYSTQTLILLGLLFYRLYMTYRRVPALALSKSAIITFIIFYIVTCIIFLTGSTLYTLAPAGIGGKLYAMSSVCIILLSIAIFGVYIHKLHSIAKTSNDEELLNMIAKNSLLAIVSISVTLFNFILFALIETFMSPHYGVVVDTFIISDIYTNALCVFLSYKTFDVYYYKICGYCDTKCIRKCLITKDPASRSMSSTESVSPIV